VRFRTVIFDLDDTLYPEWDYIRSGFVAVEHFLIKAGVEGCEGISDRWLQTRRTGERRVFDLWAASDDLAACMARRLVAPLEELAPALIEVFRQHEPTIEPFPGIEDLLASLTSAGDGECRIGLVSDGQLEVQRAKFTRLGLGGFFHATVFSDELGREFWKPNPAPFHEVLRRLRRAPDDAVYIADNPLKDFIGARAASLSTVRLRVPGGVYASIETEHAAYQADREVDSVTALMEVV
jgi:putative hydrolase of the HAD superfamily